MSHNCKYYDIENGWCKKFLNWGDAMPTVEYCTEGPCPYEESDVHKIEEERHEMAKIIADNFDINGESWDDSEFEWAAYQLQMAGYHKTKEGSND